METYVYCSYGNVPCPPIQQQSKDQTKLQSQTVDALLFFKDIDGQQFQKMQKNIL